MFRELVLPLRHLILLGVFAAVAQGGPIFSRYTISGSAGDWTLDFTLFSDIVPTEYAIHAVGLLLPDGTVTGSPDTWNATDPYNPVNAGGPDGEYWGWIKSSFTVVPNPGSISGFQIHVTTADAPLTVLGWGIALGPLGFPGQWDWHADNPDETGELQTGEPAWNFEAIPFEAPEPGTFGLLGLSLAGLAFARHRLRRRG